MNEHSPIVNVTVALELQFHIFDPRGKIVQNVKFLSVNQTCGLISKLNPTHQHESKDMLGCKIEPRIPSYCNFT